MKQSISALGGPVGGLVVAPAEKASLMSSQFDSKQCREQFVKPLSRQTFVFFLSLDAILRHSGLLSFCICFFIELTDAEPSKGIEDVWVSIQASKFKSIIVGAVYKHPNTNPECIEYLEKMLQTFSNCGEKMYKL